MLTLEDFTDTTDDEFVERVSNELLAVSGGLAEEELDLNMAMAWEARKLLSDKYSEWLEAS